MSSQTSKKTTPKITDTGLSVLHDQEDSIVDIFLVHGLQGHPRKTWACKRISESGAGATTGDSRRGFKNLFLRKRISTSDNAYEHDADEVFWPFDFLAEDCVNASILTWGYDSNVSHFFRGAVSQNNISAHAKNLLHALKIRRLKFPGRSFIFVAHSLGGIIVKDVLCRAAHDLDPAVLEVYASTEAIMFLGTPHRGSAKAGMAEIVRKIVSVSGFDTTDRNIRALEVDSAELERIHEEFMKLYEQNNRHFKALTFQEAKGMIGISYLKLNEKVVEPFSSSITTTEPTQTINANHMSMCRFVSKDDEGYKQLLGEIEILISRIQKSTKQDPPDTDGNPVNLKTGLPSLATTTSTTYSMDEIERKCVALLTQNTSDVAEYKSSLPSRVEGTCQWILSNSQYRDWNLQKDNCLLWISGYPGTGKTILSAYILEYLSVGESSPTPPTTQCYFFCDGKIETQRDGRAILRSLIHQLLIHRRFLIKYVKAAYDIHGPSLEQNFNELWRIFTTIVNDKRVGPVSVIIDAIDECEKLTRDRFVQEILKFVGNPQSARSRTSCIKFLVTSRPLPGHQYTKNLLQLDSSQNHIERDLRLVIQMKVEKIVQRTRCKPEVRAYLENALYSKADGTFLWLTLVLHLLEDSLLARQKDFKHIINELPRTLTETYERFLHGISMKHQQLGAKLLHFLVGSARPLTLEELRTLIAIEDHHRTLDAIEEDAQPNILGVIEGVLGPLVRIWDSRVSLVHQSLKEFLENLSTQTGNPLSKVFGVDLRKANLMLAEACVSYLLVFDLRRDIFSQDETCTKSSPTSPITVSTDIESIGQFWDLLDIGEDTLFMDPTISEAEACLSIGSQYNFFEYAARHWAQHFLSASSSSGSELQKSVLLLSDASSPQGLNWFRFYWFYAEVNLACPRDFIPIIAASYFGHTSSLKAILQTGVIMESDTGARAIYWASRMGHHEVVDLLFRGKINPDLMTVNGQSCLIAAVQFNRLGVVKLLLRDDGFISDNKGYRINCASVGGRTALSMAAGNGFLEIVEQLLQHSRIDPDIADFDQWTPLFWAVGGNHLEVVQALLADERVSVNHSDRSGRNVLSWAASTGELELVRFLISLKHLRAHETDLNGRTALSWAAGNGHLESTSYLRRSQRIDLLKRDNNGRNAISWACSGCHNKVVEYLIKYAPQGADQEDVDGWTPLAWALFTRAPQTVQVLLDSGLVDVNKRDRTGRSALSFAAGYGYLDVVQILLKTKGIEVESKDNDGNTPLSHATRYPDVVKTFLDYRD